MLRISLWNLDGDLGIWRVENSYSNSQITEGFWEFELRCERGTYANLALLHVVVRRVPEHARFERNLLLRTLSRSTSIEQAVIKGCCENGNIKYRRRKHETGREKKRRNKAENEPSRVMLLYVDIIFSLLFLC